MNFKYFLITLIFCPILFYLGMKNYEVWNLKDRPSIEFRKEEKKKFEKVSQEQTPEEKKPSSLESLIGISEKNIFHPERKEFPILPSISPVSGNGEVKKPLVRPQVVLYGVVSSENDQYALVGQSKKKSIPGERETITVKVGDRIGDYKVSKIIPDKIILESEGDSFDVFLYDPKSPKKRTIVRTEIKPTTITSTSPSPEPTKPATPQPQEKILERPKEIPAQPSQEEVIKSPLPTTVTPSSTPTRRTRTWWGPRPPGSD